MDRDGFVCHSATNSNCTRIVTRKLIDKSVGWIHSFLALDLHISVLRWWTAKCSKFGSQWAFMLITHLEQRGKVGKNLLLTPTRGFVYLLYLTEWFSPPARSCSGCPCQSFPAIKQRWSVAGTTYILPSHGCAAGCNPLTSLQNTAVALRLGPC